jgi:hypothetical protein
VQVMHKSSAWDSVVEEAEIRTNKRTILSLGRRKLGEPGAKGEAALSAIDDTDRLERMIDAIFDANSWKELLAVK